MAATPSEMNTIINLAGKQRMLTQKMGKEMLWVLLGVRAAENRYNLEGTAILFERTLKGLRFGDTGLSLLRVDHPDLNAQLKTVSDLWGFFQRHVHTVLTGKMGEEQLARMAEENLLLLDNMNKAVEMYVALAGGNNTDSFHSRMYTVINLAGRQRMLSQKMTKEWLLIGMGVDPSANRVRLQQSMELFERSLDGLLDGNPGLKLFPTGEPAIRSQLGSIRNLWQSYRPLLQPLHIDKRDPALFSALEKVAQMNLHLLGEVNIAVKMYESLANNSARAVQDAEGR
ncbi:type IV pili methyl-accepting chemotaxis transducer N-terminal domain-containing protein [Candidatus Magnetaquicoccus inordinatus]|uniref:type IV pili methyl-accepting chemotaxis transducer N-terminal domain-containing protein n=1 Tax=Candidatus Magnetaquicoccus inordinatus TaxID=2496818 RepID=UPI00187D0F3B|nr:type IV pili methyl-accepting chemotaxis transducer N-terminal domain-containing protein [Candidatus Magnetaquicoccus inordinatus]